MTKKDAQDHPLTKVLNDVAKEGDDGKIELGEVVKAIESRGFGSLLFIPALIAVTPVGAIPTVPSILALLIILIAGQLLLGRTHPWLPSFMTKLGIETGKYKSAIKKMKPVLTFIESHTRQRLVFLTHDTAQRVIAFVAILLALSIPPLEIVPFAVFAPAGALVLLSLGLILRDGLVTLLGLLVVVPVLYLLITGVF